MNRLWQKWINHRRPRRGVRILRNVLIGLLLIPIIWALLDYPLPREMQFRRMERTNLIPESEIVFQDEDGNIVGVLDDTVLCGSIRGTNPGDWEYRRYEIGEEPTPVPLAAPYMNYYVRADEHNRFLIFHAPDQTDRVELEIYAEYFGPYTVFASSCVTVQPGLYLMNFGFDEKNEAFHSNLPDVLSNGNTQFPYKLTFYQGDTVIGTWENTLPVGVPNKWQHNYPSY